MTDDPGGPDGERRIGRRTLLQAIGVLGLTGYASATGTASPSGQLGTDSQPVKSVFTQRLAGGITGGTFLDDVTGNGLAITDGSLHAAVTGGSNLGDEAAVFAGNADGTLGFRTLRAGANVDIREGDDEIAIEASGGGGGESNDGANLGTGTGVYDGKSGSTLEFKSLVGGTNVTLASADGEITVDASGAGEENSAANVGTGAGVYRDKTNSDLNFRSLVGLGAISTTENTDEVAIGGPWADGDGDGLLEPRSGTGYTGIDLSGVTGAKLASPWVGTRDATPFKQYVNATRVGRFDPTGADLNGNTAAGNVLLGQYAEVKNSPVGVSITGGGTTYNDHVNRAFDDYATICGGSNNRAGVDDTNDQQMATIGGGFSNTASAADTVVSGGAQNTASGNRSAVGGGANNVAETKGAVVGGGEGNTARGADQTTVAGGYQNLAEGWRATVGGGNGNSASNDEATVGGGKNNTASARWAVVAGGQDNTASGEQAMVAGGVGNTASALRGVIGGGWHNEVKAAYGTIAGGGAVDPNDGPGTKNVVYDDFGTVGGGGNNQAGSNDGTATSAPYATVGGGEENTAAGKYATIGGGFQNGVSNESATVGGGYNNTASGQNATVGGGSSNTASGQTSTIGGGYGHETNAQDTTIAGGTGSIASSRGATIGGGGNNDASGLWSTIPGGQDNVAASSYSFAAGRRAKAENDGAFVWADSQNADFSSKGGTNVSGKNTFHVRAKNGARVVNSAGTTYIPSGSTGWSPSSTKELKTNFQSVDNQEILDGVRSLEITTWEYKDDDGSGAGVEHIGPMAEAFYEAFELGDSDQHINSINMDGVALAAIQGLAAKLDAATDRVDDLERELAASDERVAELEAELEAKDDRIDELEAEREAQAERLDDLEARLAKLEASAGEGGENEEENC